MKKKKRSTIDSIVCIRDEDRKSTIKTSESSFLLSFDLQPLGNDGADSHYAKEGDGNKPLVGH